MQTHNTIPRSLPLSSTTRHLVVPKPGKFSMRVQGRDSAARLIFCHRSLPLISEDLRLVQRRELMEKEYASTGTDSERDKVGESEGRGGSREEEEGRGSVAKRSRSCRRLCAYPLDFYAFLSTRRTRVNSPFNYHSFSLYRVIDSRCGDGLVLLVCAGQQSKTIKLRSERCFILFLFFFYKDLVYF